MRFVEAMRGTVSVFAVGSLALLLASPMAWAESATPASESPFEGNAGPASADLPGQYPELGPVVVHGSMFPTLQEAVDAIGTDPAIPGNRATLLAGIEESVTIPAGKDIAIDLLAQRLSGEAGKPTIVVKAGAKLTLIDSAGDLGELTGTPDGCPALLVEKGGVVELRSGVIKRSGSGPAVDNRGFFSVYPAARVEGEILGGAVQRDHAIVAVPEIPATCDSAGVAAHWRCGECGVLFSDAEGSAVVTEDRLVLPCLGHGLIQVPATSATEQAEGNIEYWKCERCGRLFADPNWDREIAEDDTVLPKLAPQAGSSVNPSPQLIAPGVAISLPQTGDDSALPIAIAGIVGALAVVVGLLIKRRGGRG